MLFGVVSRGGWGLLFGFEDQQTIRRRSGNALAFVLGMAIAIAALGSIAAFIGRIADIGQPAKYVIATIPILIGVFRLGWVRVPLFTSKAFAPSVGGAFGTGLLLPLVIGPCGTPILASVLSYAAYQQSFAHGGLLLFLYGLGTGLPVVLVGTAAGGLLKTFDCSRFGRVVDPVLGSALLLLGFYLLWRI